MTRSLAWKFSPFGEAALLIEADTTDVLANRYALALATALEALAFPGLLATVPALGSLLLRFDPLRCTHEQLEAQVRDLLADLAPAPEQPTRIVEIPVVYGGEHGPDLESAAELLGLSAREVVALHSGQVYRVMMIGFAPGFPYIGPLPEQLAIPRRTTPRAAVPARSVAIAAGLTGIYPKRLPGGWHIIGCTPLEMFDPQLQPPALLAPGDGVRFVPLAEGVQP